MHHCRAEPLGALEHLLKGGVEPGTQHSHLAVYQDHGGRLSDILAREKVGRIRKCHDLKPSLAAGPSEDREEQAGGELAWDEAIFSGADQDNGSRAGSFDQVREVDGTSPPEGCRQGRPQLMPPTREAHTEVPVTSTRRSSCVR